MKTATLTRLETGPEGTFGELEYDGKKLASGELSWRNNATDISCIPIGEYKCVWTPSARFKRNTYRLENVAGRDAILIHSANWMGDKDKGKICQLNGCIALGSKVGVLNGQKALVSSGSAVLQLEKDMGGEPFLLTIREA